MNGANPSLPHSPSTGDRPPERVGRIHRTLTALSFWGAIALPAVYLPLLAAGIDTTGGLTTFLLLFGLHVSALVGGRRYGSHSAR